MIKCQHCGKQIPYDANLCPYCGKSIKQFQQKEVLEGEEPATAPEVSETIVEPTPAPPPPHSQGDRRLLFFIIAVLALLLIVGSIYHYSSIKTDDEDEEEVTDTTQVKVPEEEQLKAKEGDSQVSYNPKKSQQVVVNGEGVRLRFGPSLKANYLKDEKGATKSVKKGTRLECIGEDGDWYQVVYMGKKYYMSKQYTYLVE
ncbi:MAG: zinc-ribbon domain-containing protein [Prevotella sp.]|nr:zinc-ribbon domain-containing protein [Prevotella sp.]